MPLRSLKKGTDIIDYKENLSHLFRQLEFKHYEESKAAVEEILAKIKSNMRHYESNYIQSTAEEHIALYELAMGYHQKPDTVGHIVECGSYCGASSAVLATATSRGSAISPAVCVDSYRLDPASPFSATTHSYVYSRFVRSLFSKGIQDAWCRVIFDSVDFLNFWKLPTRMIFIDTAHTYEYTKKEIYAALSCLCDDGWLIFHDYADWRHLNSKEWEFGIFEAVNEFYFEQDTYDIKAYRFSDNATDLNTALVGFHLKGDRK